MINESGADVVVLDGMQGGTAATQDVFIEHVGIPTLACLRPAVKALQDLGMHRKVQLIVSGGIRNGADVAKALALGAAAVSIGPAALVALGDNDPALEDEYHKLGTSAGCYDDWHEGRDPAGAGHPVAIDLVERHRGTEVRELLEERGQMPPVERAAPSVEKAGLGGDEGSARDAADDDAAVAWADPDNLDRWALLPDKLRPAGTVPDDWN